MHEVRWGRRAANWVLFASVFFAGCSQSNERGDAAVEVGVTTDARDPRDVGDVDADVAAGEDAGTPIVFCEGLATTSQACAREVTARLDAHRGTFSHSLRTLHVERHLAPFERDERLRGAEKTTGIGPCPTWIFDVDAP